MPCIVGLDEHHSPCSTTGMGQEGEGAERKNTDVHERPCRQGETTSQAILKKEGVTIVLLPLLLSELFGIFQIVLD